MQAKTLMFLYSIRKCKKTLKFDNVEVDKKEFHTSKQTIALVNVDQILVSDKFKHSDTSFKFFIGYNDDNIIRPLWLSTSLFRKILAKNKDEKDAWIYRWIIDNLELESSSSE